MALVTELVSRLTASLTGTAGLAPVAAPLSLEDHFQMLSGTASGQADKIYSVSATLGASGTANLDLQGSLLDAFGAAFTPVKLKLIRVTAAAGNTNDVQVTRPGANGVPLFMAAGDGIAVSPGGIFEWYSPVGVTVTAATGDLLTFTNSGAGTSVTYGVVLIGTSV